MTISHSGRNNRSSKPNGNKYMQQCVERARLAQQTWAVLSPRVKTKHLLNWRREIVRRLEDFASLIHKENGKPYSDAVMEIFGALFHFTHTVKRAPKALKIRSVSSGIFLNYKAMIQYQPMGVIAVISPWNMPFSIAMNQIVAALAAGNSVILKPSEVTPEVGKLIGETARTAIPFGDLVQVISGDGVVGANLVRSGVDKVAVTGHYETGKAVMQIAAETVTPVLLELGGKDALIVASDADLDKAARRIVWGSFVLAGQSCISVERCYVAHNIYNALLKKVLTECQSLSVGPEGDIPLIAQSEHVGRIRLQVQDALAKGAKMLYGSLDSISGTLVPPMILTDVDDRMRITHEEIFGPVLTIHKVADLDTSIEAANASPYALGASVFGGNKAVETALRLQAGMVSINTVWAYALIGGLPFGGYGKSGFGRIHGDAGLFEFSNIKSIAIERFSLPVDLMSFGVTKTITVSQLIAGIKLLYGRSAISRLFRLS